MSAERPAVIAPGEQTDRGLVLSYRDPLIRYFSRRGVAPVLAEDLAQDCFTRLFALNGREHIANEEAYLFQVAASVYADHLRLPHSRHAARHVPVDDFNAPAEVLAPDRVFEGREGVKRLVEALAELKPKTREIFLLNRMDGLSYTQIAVRFGVTPSAIEKQMMKAIAHLNLRLGAWRP